MIRLVLGGLAVPCAGQNLVNLSTLAKAGTSVPLTAGFVIGPGASKTVLIRAIGPGLSGFSVAGFLPHPILTVFASGNPAPLATVSNGWGGSAQLAAVFSQVGAFSLAPASLDAAVELTLSPGLYTAQATGAGGSTGTCLVEIYDVSVAGSQLINLSSLLSVGSSPPTFGISISPGAGSRRLLIRGVGPSLASFGVPGILSDPAIAVTNVAAQQIVAQNDNWSSGDVVSLNLAFAAAGAFPLLAGSADAALVADFAPGEYTVQGTGSGGATGTALIEVYDITPAGPNQVTVAASAGSADDSGKNPGTFTFSRSGDVTLPLTISYSTSGTAVAGVDYAPLAGAVTIPAGAFSATATVTPYPTINPNATTTTVVTLQPGDGYVTGAPASASLTIKNLPTTLYAAVLRPPAGASASTAFGTASLLVNPGSSLAVLSVSFSNLSSPEVIGHVEIGTPGQNGSYVFALSAGQVKGQTWTFAPAGPYQPADLAAALAAGNIFVEIDSANYPAGELAGSFLKAAGSQAFVVPPAPPALPASALSGPTDATNASRLLTQATFGPTSADLAKVESVGVSAWIDQQLAVPATSHLAAVRADAAAFPNPRVQSEATYYYMQPVNQQAAWWKIALTAPDQLRQRVAFALSEIMVVSLQGAGLVHAVEPMAKYYDQLAGDAFGNFRTLLQDVTLSPVMGTYLSSLHNQKGNAALGTSADENYAREVQQLFTIGPVKLQPDGTLLLDGTGQPVPTYDQNEIVQTANVFTGWSFANASNNFFANPLAGVGVGAPLPDNNPWLNPMQPYSTYHDTSAKTIVGGTVIPAGGTASSDLQAELDALFQHPNTGPFVCRQLIQRLVTSNPSPGYVYRVAQVFADDGTGTRGNLGAVVKAILTDYEARSSAVVADAGYGKLKEPLLRVTGLLRAQGATSTNGRWIEFVAGAPQNSGLLATPLGPFEQAALSANTVFNFFAPSFTEPGPLASAGLVAPEFQIVNAQTVVTVPNALYTFVFNREPPEPANFLTIDLSGLATQASNPSALLAQLSLLYCGNGMSSATQTRIAQALQAMPASATATDLAATALYLTVTSADAAVQR